MGWRERVQRREARRWNRYMYEEALKSKYKPNGKSVEIIGMPSAVFTHLTTDQNPGSLTQTTFDTDSRADSAQILLTNSTGVSRVIIAAWIRGKPVTRYSDTKAGSIPGAVGGSKGGSRGGYLHDKFVDYESIAKNGERVFETGNNFTVTADQVNKLADYYWKLNKTKKHIYTLSLVGFQTWYEPGEWYTLQIGGAGEAEYIDSTVECLGVQCSLTAGGAPSTSVSFREVEENWKFDSNEVARQIAAGDFSRRTNNNVVTVAAQYYSGYADYYCDGTDDQEEINNAVSYAGTIGGTVKLTRGTFNITSSITVTSNINILGEGEGTEIITGQPATAYSVFYSAGSSGSYIQNVSICSLLLDFSEKKDNSGYIRLDYVDGYRISNIVVRNPVTYNIYGKELKNGSVTSCRIGNASSVVNVKTYGINITNTTTSVSNIIQGNIIDNLWGNSESIGILLLDSVSKQSCLIANNKISNISTQASSLGLSYGIAHKGMYNIISSNQITGTYSGSAAVGLYIESSSLSVICSNNNCFNNGADAGIANTNEQNFSDDGIDTQWAG